MYSLQIAFLDEAKNSIEIVGGASFCSEIEWENSWKNIEKGSEKERYLVDKIDLSGDIVADKPISKRTAEVLLGRQL